MDVRQLVRSSGNITPHSLPPVAAGYVSNSRPAPTSFSQPLYVIVPSHSTERAYGPLYNWPADHGSTLPAQGTPVVLVFDDTGAPTVVWWGHPGTVLAAPVTDYAAPSPGGIAAGDLTGSYPSPTIAALAVTDAKVATANKDGLTSVPSMRTLGTGNQQAAAGNDSRIVGAVQAPLATRVLFGGVTPTGTVFAAGSGNWTVSRTALGTYLVTPTVTVTNGVIATANVNNALGQCSTNFGSAPSGAFTIFTANTSGAAADQYSLFTAFGY